MKVRGKIRAAFGAVVLVFVLAGAVFAGNAGAGGARIPAQAAVTQGCGVVPLDVELIIDNSGSMGSEQSGSPLHTRMYWAQQAAGQLVDALDANGGVGGASGIHHIGVTRFSGTTSTTVGALGTSDATTVKGWINGLSPSGSTPLKLGMATGAADMNANARNAVGGAVQRILILLTDGRPNPDGPTNGSYGNGSSQRPTSANAADYLASADIAYSIAIGTGGSGLSNVDTGLMQLLDKPDGHYYNVVDASNLSGLFGDIFSQIACPAHVVADKKVDKSTANPGDTLNYTITLNNDGGSDATGVAVHDNISVLLASGTFGTCDNGCTHDANSVDWTGLTVPNGGSLVLHFTIDLNADGWAIGTTDLPNKIVVEGTNCNVDSDDSDCSTDTTVTVEAPPPTPTFFQSVEGLTNPPTQPSTSTVDGSNQRRPSDAAWLLLVALGALLATLLVVTPRPARRRP